MIHPDLKIARIVPGDILPPIPMDGVNRKKNAQTWVAAT
jgi:hypothetical protein